MQLDKFADMVVLTIKTALAPVLERVAAAEARLAVVGDLRDRVITVETKAASIVTSEPVAFDAAPLLDRFKALEAEVFITQDRLLVVETKAAMPAPVLETRIDGPSATDVELAITKAMAPISERLAVMETRSPVPGPAGKDGANGTDGTTGKDGLNGKDGVDGLGFDDLQAVQEDDRSFTIKAARGERVKAIGTARFPVQIQRGVYIEGKSYEQGDLVTWGGSQWHCNETTVTKPGESAKAWTLVVKRGRDGRDGKDAEGALPVVSVGSR